MDSVAGGAAGVPEKATFAGGCFWCMQPPFDGLQGVISTRVGYTAGLTPDPTYQEVCSGVTGHAEAIELSYDPQQITYADLLEVFWRNIDPTASNRQFCDAGTQYRTAIFYHNEEQRRLAQASKDALERSGNFSRPIVTEILPAATFYEAEDYHQDYYRKAPARYGMYKRGSGREDFLIRMWGDKPR